MCTSVVRFPTFFECSLFSHTANTPNSKRIPWSKATAHHFLWIFQPCKDWATERCSSTHLCLQFPKDEFKEPWNQSWGLIGRLIISKHLPVVSFIKRLSIYRSRVSIRVKTDYSSQLNAVQFSSSPWPLRIRRWSSRCEKKANTKRQWR